MSGQVEQREPSSVLWWLQSVESILSDILPRDKEGHPTLNGDANQDGVSLDMAVKLYNIGFSNMDAALQLAITIERARQRQAA